MQVDVKSFFDALEQVFKVINPKVNVMSTLQKNLPSPQSDCFLYLLSYNFKRMQIGVFVSLFSVKGTKSTVGNTDICVVYITVNNIGYDSYLSVFFWKCARLHYLIKEYQFV